MTPSIDEHLFQRSDAKSGKRGVGEAACRIRRSSGVYVGRSKAKDSYYSLIISCISRNKVSRCSTMLPATQIRDPGCQRSFESKTRARIRSHVAKGLDVPPRPRAQRFLFVVNLRNGFHLSRRDHSATKIRFRGAKTSCT